jgi:hypothetical protein
VDIHIWMNAHPSAFAALLLVYFLTLWLVVSTIASYLGGWSLLSARFRTDTPFLGSKWGGQSASMRWRCNYGRCLTVGADQEALFLRTMFLFRFLHPPLLIPWNEISVSTKRLWIFGECVTLTLGSQERIPLMIRAKLARLLKEAAGGHWPVESI